VEGPSIHSSRTFCLQLENEGLGACLTTFLAAEEPRAAELLGLPKEQAIAALIGLGFPPGPFKRLKRRPVEEFVTTDRFDGIAFGLNSGDDGSGPAVSGG
jgi:nitroreductase